MSLDGTVARSASLPLLSSSVVSPPTRAHATNAATLSVAASAFAQISPASQLMSKLGQLSQQNPAQFKAVTSEIAARLAAQSADTKEELVKRVALEAELAHVQQAAAIATSSSASGAATADPTSGASSALASAFSAASESGSFGSTAGATALTWTSSGLAGALAGALAVVDRALGMSAG